MATCSAESARRRLRDWLQVEDGGPQHPAVDVFLVADSRRIVEIERSLGIVYTEDPAVRAEAAGGGYFASFRTILLEVSEARSANLEWFVSHEVCHVVLGERAGELPDVINEGLAELLPQWILWEKGRRRPESVRYLYPENAEICARLVREGNIPPLEQFIQLDRHGFHADRDNHFPLAWSLMRTLLCTWNEEVRGRVPTLLERRHEKGGSLENFERVYDLALVERLWKHDLERLELRYR